MSTVSQTPPSRDTPTRTALRRIMATALSGAPLDQCLQAVLTATQAITGAPTAAIGLYAKDARAIEVVEAAGPNASELRGMRTSMADSLASEALVTGRPCISIGLGAAAPIICEGEVAGALMATSSPDRPFSAQVLDELGTLAEHAAVALRIDEERKRGARSARELAVLYDAAQTVSGSLNVQDVLSSVLDTVCSHFEHQAAMLYLLNDERTHLFIAAERGLCAEEREVQLSALDEAIAAMLESGAPCILDAERALDEGQWSDSATSLPPVPPLLEALTTPCGTRSAVVAPIRNRSDTLGVLLLTASTRYAYTPEDARLLGAVAAQSGVAIANAWLYEHATRRTEEATALYDLSQRIGGELEPDQVFELAADSVMNLLKVDRFALMILDREDQRLRARATRGIGIDAFSTACPRRGEGIAGWVFEWQTPTAVSDVAADLRNVAAPIDAMSAVCVPLSAGDQELGVMLAMSSRRRLFTVAELELIYTIANQAAVALVNANLYKSARARSAEMRRYFHRMAHALGAALHGHDVPQLLADIALAVMRADRCVVYRIEGETARVRAASGFWATEPPDALIGLGDGLAGLVARRGRSLVIGDLDDVPAAEGQPWLAHQGMVSYVGVPLKIGRRTVGVVELCTSHARRFAEDEVRILSQFAQRARVAERLIAGQGE